MDARIGPDDVMPTGGAKDVRAFRRRMSNCEQLAVCGLFDADAVIALRPGEEASEAGGSLPRRAKHKEDEMMGVDWTDPRLIAGGIAVVAMVVVGIVLAVRWRKQKTAKLREHFGPEYDQAVLTHGSAGKAEAKLTGRETRVERMRLRDLSIGERVRFQTAWKAVQSRFVDHPKTAVSEADELVSSLMIARGYPVAAFDQRAADISVHHPRLVESYRSAHEIAVRVGKDQASTEDLRVAMIKYRTLFDELAEEQMLGEIKAVA